MPQGCNEFGFDYACTRFPASALAGLCRAVWCRDCVGLLRWWRWRFFVVAQSAACGTAAGRPPAPTPTDIPATDAEAARFLTQATFGATRVEIDRLRQIGYGRWIDEQIDPGRTRPTLVLPRIQQIFSGAVAESDWGQQYRRNYWLWQAASAPDQLRMRMAFALSEIMVVSDRDTTRRQVTRIADYQDTLARNAFGSYRQLLKDVTLHPAMGVYLSYVGNRKATADGRVVPDENYAREVMQLFSIGLVERNPDFSPRLDAQGNTVPTYDQAVIAAMSRVFTGWTYAGLQSNQFGRLVEETHAPMECHPGFHDDQPKTIFRGIVINEGNDCKASLERVLDALSEHPNTAPFISRQLIQRFVSSNPSPAYIGRVSKAWTDSRGDLGKVVRAILLDVEARSAPSANDAAYGKPREPLIKLVALWRAFDARYTPAAGGVVRFRFSSAWDLSTTLLQDSQRSPSVFNFFEPDFRLPASDAAPGIYAPEFQVINEASFTDAHNVYADLVNNYSNATGEAPAAGANAPSMNFAKLVALADAGDHAGMVAEVNLLLFHGSLSAASSQVMVGMLDNLRNANRGSLERARSLVALAASSPEYAIQR